MEWDARQRRLRFPNFLDFSTFRLCCFLFHIKPQVQSSMKTILRQSLAQIVAHRGSFVLLSPQRPRISLTQVFLPKGYPHSVSSDYLPFTTYQFIQSVSGTLAGTLSTQALLHALGLGAGSALGIAATLNWIIKDGMGLLGGVLYAGFMGTRFDDSPKVRIHASRGLSMECISVYSILHHPHQTNTHTLAIQILGRHHDSTLYAFGNPYAFFSILFSSHGFSFQCRKKYWMVGGFGNACCNASWIYQD